MTLDTPLKKRYSGGLEVEVDDRRPTEVCLRGIAYNGQQLLQLS